MNIYKIKSLFYSQIQKKAIALLCNGFFLYYKMISSSFRLGT